MPENKATVHDIKRKVEKYQGRTVRLEAHKSKKKLYQKTGVIESVYPSIFTVNIEDDSHARNQRMSFSYIDVLTKNVKIDLVDGNGGSVAL